MKTLGKFECSRCIIKFEMQTTNEVTTNYKNKLYRITTIPKRFNFWEKYYKEFNFSKDAKEFYINEVNYWIFK